ncbi:TonB family protein [Methylophaga sp. SB9B]|uniref:TonB family protein n=1 Tax=Methylophaga sp. SB9B TaxID=2570356 RepID=UPI0010A9354D|nr:TonB family protein [Methylophaga sp. SB9B]THK41199.1 TonB family protein [Methylophaga sp. SB9B]
MTTLVPDFSSAQAVGSERMMPGFLLALLIHIGLIILFLPVMEYSPPAAPMRIAVQVTQLQEKVEPVIDEPEIIEPEPIIEPVELIKPPIIDKQILIAKDDTPPEPEELLVLEPIPEEKIIEEVKPIEPPPKPEPVKPEPKKVEKPKPKVEPKPEKPKVVEKPKQEEPVAETIVAEVVEPVTTLTKDSINEAATEISPLPSSTVNSNNASSTSTAANATGDNPNEATKGGADEVDRNEAWKGYGQLLYAMVSKNKQYPQQAIRRHLEGIVMVSVRFEKGEMVEINVLGQGSGHTVLDKAAREMLENAVKEMPVRGNLSNKSFTVVVPVDFKLTG